MEDARSERGTEKERGVLDVREDHQHVRVGRRPVQDRAGLEHNLVGAEVGAF